MNRLKSSALTPRSQAWRQSTAVRAFGFAFVVGLSLSNAALRANATVLVALALVALAAAATEATSQNARMRWVPVLEGIVVAVLLGAAGYDVSLAPYLLVPPVVAGARHGWVPALNTALLVILATISGTTAVANDALLALSAHLPWAVLGLGGGLLAGWQTRRLRESEERQAPFAAAHRLVSQLHRLVDSQTIAFDPVHIAETLAHRLATVATTGEISVMVTEGEPLVTLAGPTPRATDATVLNRCLGKGAPQQHADTTVYLPLKLEDRTFGAVVIGSEANESLDIAALQAMVDETVLPLETAMLFNAVRERATSQERARLAREIHDGVAQEIVALGYLIDELEEHSGTSETRSTAASLRHEVDRILGGLRSSVFDLRHNARENTLSDALASYSRQVNATSSLVVHLSRDEIPTLPHHIKAEALRIAQEAIGNARRHAHADHLYVSLAPTQNGFSMRIEDDGIGGAVPTAGHYGMHTMRERAEGIGARLVVEPGAGRGTAVALEWSKSEATPEARSHELHSPAGR